MGMTSHYMRCAGREIHFMDWTPDPGQPCRGQVLAWHGLARTGRDMDALAQHLSVLGWRVVCPDTLGRGLSQWSPEPAAEYNLAFYARLASELLDQLGWRDVHWVGTSMGGAIGTVCASGRLEPDCKTRIRSLVLNDNAPELAAPALERIKTYAGQPASFATMSELEQFFRTVYQPFGELSDAQWRQLAESSMRRLPDGRVTPHYDPALVQQFVQRPDDYLLWEDYDRLELPVLCLHGVHSDLVLPPVLEQMRSRGPGARGLLRVHDIEGCGHAPALHVPEQWALITQFWEDMAAV